MSKRYQEAIFPTLAKYVRQIYPNLDFANSKPTDTNTETSIIRVHGKPYTPVCLHQNCTGQPCSGLIGATITTATPEDTQSLIIKIEEPKARCCRCRQKKPRR